MSEDAIRAARMMQSAADDMLQAARNIQGSVDQMQRILDQASCDGASLVSRLEEIARKRT